MSSILIEPVALDTNQYVFGIRRSPGYSACVDLIRSKLGSLRVFLPREVILELHRNLFEEEIRAVYRALREAKELIQDYSAPNPALIEHYVRMESKSGDARICAHLHEAGIRWLITKNRHFLSELPDLPFRVLTAGDAITLL